MRTEVETKGKSPCLAAKRKSGSLSTNTNGGFDGSSLFSATCVFAGVERKKNEGNKRERNQTGVRR